MPPYCLREPPGGVPNPVNPAMPGQEPEMAEGSNDGHDEEFADLLQLPPNVLPESFPLENSLPQLLMSQSGVSEEYELSTQTSIRLRVIARDMSLQRISIYMPALIELDLSGSCLTSLRDLGCGLRLQTLKVRRCGLDCLDGLFGLTTLRELDASNNNIADAGSCAILPRIQTIDLSNNLVDNLGQIGFLSICAHLRDLNLTGCPIVMIPGYRDLVATLLPGLHMLDGQPFAVDEIDENEEYDEDNESIDDVEDSADDVDEESKVEAVRDEDDKRHQSKACDKSLKNNTELNMRKTNQRPSTSLGIRHPLNRTQGSKRPQTARTQSRNLDTCYEEPTMIDQEDSTSLLTSGVIVCGNLTAALRRKKVTKTSSDAWLNKTDDLSGNGQVQLKRLPENRTKEINALLDASRRWREAYSSFRNMNRAKWQKEEEEENACENENGNT